MCYPKPGPRCASHARTTRDRAISHFEAADAALNAAQQVYDEVSPNVTVIGGDNVNEVMIVRNGVPYARSLGVLAAAKTQRRKALQELVAAQADYESTPAGQKDLKDQLAQTTPGRPDRERLKSRLDTARAARRQQLQAWKQYLDEGPGPKLDDVDPKLRKAVRALRSNAEDAVDGLPALDEAAEGDRLSVTHFREQASRKAHAAALELCDGDTVAAAHLVHDMQRWHKHRLPRPSKLARDLVNDPDLPEAKLLRDNARIAATAKDQLSRDNAQARVCRTAYQLAKIHNWKVSARELFRAVTEAIFKAIKHSRRRTAA